MVGYFISCSTLLQLIRHSSETAPEFNRFGTILTYIDQTPAVSFSVSLIYFSLFILLNFISLWFCILFYSFCFALFYFILLVHLINSSQLAQILASKSSHFPWPYHILPITWANHNCDLHISLGQALCQFAFVFLMFIERTHIFLFLQTTSGPTLLQPAQSYRINAVCRMQYEKCCKFVSVI